MPRANRYIVSGPAYHLTHRCHNRDFLLRFAKDRDAYRQLLHEQLATHTDIRLLTYCITSNHVHLLVTSCRSNESVSAFMKDVQGQFAQSYNRRKKRKGAYWSDRFHATMIDNEEYLWHCMRYIDLNMVRAGVVRHPSEWAWCGYQEISGARKRYRTVNMAELCRRTNQIDETTVATWYFKWVSDTTAAEIHHRNKQWTESIAVGSKSFVELIGDQMINRSRLEMEQGTSGSWVIKEPPSSYNDFSATKNASNEVLLPV